MYLKLVLEEVGELVLKFDNKELYEKLHQYVPFESEVHVWKEEIYFKTPLDYTPKKYVSRLEKGSVAYWKPGRALCVFYGISQPYSKVEKVGLVVGIPSYLRSVKEGSKVRVKEYEHHDAALEEIKFLRDRGIEAVSRLDEEGNICICMSIGLEEYTLGLEVVKEEYGYYIETDSVFKFTNSLEDIALVTRLKHKISSISEDVRVDLNEDNWLVISSTADMEREDLYNKIMFTVKAFKALMETLRDY